VRGRIVDADGKPLVACFVATRTAEPQVASQSVRSDGEGRFAISAPLATRFRVVAWEDRVPYQPFSSALQHGPATDVVLTRPAAADARHVTLRCVDAATKTPIPEFRASRSEVDSLWPTLAILDHPRARQLHRGEATFDVGPDPSDATRGVFVVDAPGHGTVAVPIPGDAKEPLVVELPAECFLAGRVLDAETGKPAAGVAVCALSDPRDLQRRRCEAVGRGHGCRWSLPHRWPRSGRP